MKKEGIIVYETPKIITYSKEDILEEMGPAQACARAVHPARARLLSKLIKKNFP